MCSREDFEKQLDEIPAEFSYPGCDSLREIHTTLHAKPFRFVGSVDIQKPYNRARDIAIAFAGELKVSNPYAPRILELSQELLETHKEVVNHKL